jgi:hypothetical protein
MVNSSACGEGRATRCFLAVDQARRVKAAVAPAAISIQAGPMLSAAEASSNPATTRMLSKPFLNPVSPFPRAASSRMVAPPGDTEAPGGDKGGEGACRLPGMGRREGG